MLTEDYERFLRLPLSGRSASGSFPVAFVVPPLRFVLFPRVFRFRCSRMSVCGRNLLQKVRKSLLFSRGCITFAHGSSKKRDVWTLFRLPLRDAVRRDGRVVDYSSLENCRTERYRGFESLSLRKLGCISASYAIYALYYTRKFRVNRKDKPSSNESLYKETLELGFIY